MIVEFKKYLKRCLSGAFGIEALAERTEREVGTLRDQICALREDVSKLSAAVDNMSSSISLIYDCLIEFDKGRQSNSESSL